MARRKVINSPTEVDASEHPEDNGSLTPGPGRESFKLAQYWKSQVAGYEQATRKWNKRGNGVVKRFRDERNRMDEEGQRRMNLLWANYKVMKPAIYSRCPDPIVDRKFLDRDPVGRISSQMLERTLKNELGTSGYHDSISMAVDDRLLPGRGVVWARYVPTFGKGDSIPAPTTNGAEDPLFKIGQEMGDKSLTEDTQEEDQLEDSGSQVIAEKIEVDYVDWHDFMHFPVKARTWKEVQAVGKVVHISKKEAIERFGEKIGNALKPDTEPTVLGNTDRQGYSDTAVFQDINERNITIHEIWNKSDKRAYWISTGYDYLCDVLDDPLELTEFLPVPAPLYATKTNDTLIPVPDFCEWQDQAIQIDELKQRIAMLSKACKVAGVYDASKTQINRIFNESIENELIPVDQWALYGDGGLKSYIEFIPIDIIQSAIETLSNVRQQAMVDLDQITGLSDIVRGTSDSRETLGGIRLKNNNAGTRLSESQEEVARFARDTLNIMAEIVCKHFSDETIIESSGILYDDALQPDTIMREFMANQGSAQATQQKLPQQPPLQLSPPQQAPQAQVGSNPQQPPMGQGAPPAPTGNNIVPFPGGQQGGPPAPQQPQQMPMAPAPMQPQPPDPQTLIMMKVMKALELLRKDVARGYRIDIETDSTIFGDKEQDKQNVNEFLTALGGYMKQLESISTVPEAMPMFAKALQWGIRRYRTGRDLEAEIDTFCELIKKKSKDMIENPQPSPDQQKADAEIKQMQMEASIQNSNDERDAQRQAANDQREMAIQSQKDQAEKEKMELDAQIELMKAQNEKEMMEMQMQIAREKHQLEVAKIRAEMHQSAQEHHIQLEQNKHEVQMHKQEQSLDKEDHKLDKQKLDHKKKEHTHRVKVQKQQQQKKAS